MFAGTPAKQHVMSFIVVNNIEQTVHKNIDVMKYAEVKKKLPSIEKCGICMVLTIEWVVEWLHLPSYLSLIVSKVCTHSMLFCRMFVTGSVQRGNKRPRI